MNLIRGGLKIGMTTFLKLIANSNFILIVSAVAIGGCGSVKYDESVRKVMLPGLEDTYEIEIVYPGRVYNYGVAVTEDTFHPDEIYFAMGSNETIILNSSNLWQVLSADYFDKDKINRLYAEYLFKIEFSEYALIGDSDDWRRNPYYCKKLDEIIDTSDSHVDVSVYASFLDRFILVDYGIVNNSIVHTVNKYTC